MARPTWARTPLTSSLFLGLGALGASAFLLGFVILSLLPWTTSALDNVALATGIASAWVYVFAGLFAWGRRPSNHLGAIMVFAGFTFLIDLLSNLPGRSLYTVGVIVASLPLGAVVQLLLSFPTGTLRSRLARQTVAAGYFVCLVLQAPLYLFGPSGAPMGFTERPALFTAAQWTQRGAGLLVMLVTTYILAGRWRQSPASSRWVLGPLYLYGVVAVLFVPFCGAVLAPRLHLSIYLFFFAETVVLGVVPILITVAVLRGGFARTGEVQEFASWLAADASHRPVLVEGLATTLGDPSVELVYWSSDGQGYVDDSGAPAVLPDGTEGRAIQQIRVQARLVGAVLYDTTLNPDPDEVAAIGRVVALSVDRDRLNAELLASREALRQSRARIVEAGQRERRSVALALHDGLQGRLVMLSVRAGRFATDATLSDQSRADAAKLRGELDEAAHDLRDVVHRIMPAALIERGLAAALEDLVDRTPIPTTLSVTPPEIRLPDYLEGLAYFVVSEALTNVVKHAQADRVAVAVRVDPERIHLRIEDNGVGGARGSGGLGLRAMQDRVAALDGTVRVEDGAAGGTCLVAAFPVIAPAAQVPV